MNNLADFQSGFPVSLIEDAKETLAVQLPVPYFTGRECELEKLRAEVEYFWSVPHTQVTYEYWLLRTNIVCAFSTLRSRKVEGRRWSGTLE